MAGNSNGFGNGFGIALGRGSPFGALGSRPAIVGPGEEHDGDSCGGDGHDEGGPFDNRITGGDSNDTLSGTPLNDLITGGKGSDTLSGGDGNDQLVGGKGQDWLEGDLGDDRLIGGKVRDQLYGGAGNDTLTGGKSDDLLVGGTGADTLNSGRGYNDLYGDNQNGIWDGESDRFMLCPKGYAVIHDFDFARDSLGNFNYGSHIDHLQIHAADVSELSFGLTQQGTVIQYNGDLIALLMGRFLPNGFDLTDLFAPSDSWAHL
jgi:Ca2+-binding RTX toxin-like protein